MSDLYLNIKLSVPFLSSLNNNLFLSRIISLFWAIVLISIALVFDEGDSAIVIIGLQIASFTYGALLGLFILAKINKDFKPASIAEGLIVSIGFILLLAQSGLAWTYYIACGVIINVVTVYIVEEFTILFKVKKNF